MEEHNADRSNLKILREGLVERSLHMSVSLEIRVDGLGHRKDIFLGPSLAIELTHRALNQLFNR